MSVDYSFLIVDDVEPPLPSGQQFWHAVAILPFGDHRSLFAAAVVFDANSIWQAVPRRLKLETHGLGANDDWRQGNSSDGQRFVWTMPIRCPPIPAGSIATDNVASRTRHPVACDAWTSPGGSTTASTGGIS